MQNLESVFLMVSEKRCLDMTDRQTDGQGEIDFSLVLIKNIYNLYGLTSLLPPVTYILPKLIRPFLRESVF